MDSGEAESSTTIDYDDEATLEVDCVSLIEFVPPRSTWSQAIKSFVLALIDFVFGGFRQVPAEVAAHRLAICRACPHLDQQLEQCTLCKCFVQLKTRAPDERCPLEPPRWDVER